jgi:hypothetical protein
MEYSNKLLLIETTQQFCWVPTSCTSVFHTFVGLQTCKTSAGFAKDCAVIFAVFMVIVKITVFLNATPFILMQICSVNNTVIVLYIYI